MGLTPAARLLGRAVDALLGKTFDAVLPDGTAAILRVSSIDPDRQTVVLFVVSPVVEVRRRTYDLATFGRLIREEWTESCHP